MAFPRPASPRALVQDLRAFAGQRPRHQLLAALFAVAMPVVIVVAFYFDSKTNILPGEQIVYAESWSANRTDAEIVAQQKVDQAKRAEEQKARQEAYQKLEKRLGI